MWLGILAGLYALIAGRIGVTRRLRISGRNARIFGVLLIVVSLLLPLVIRLLAPNLPPAFLENDAARIAGSTAILVVIFLLLAIPFRDRVELTVDGAPAIITEQRRPEGVLSIRNLHVSYGTIPALHGIDLDVQQGEIVTLIGANGAGKTTTLRAVSGLLHPRTGDVFFKGRSIRNVRPHVITAMGVSHVPEGRGIFANLTVSDNLELGAYLRKDKVQKSEYQRIFSLFPVLEERIKQNAGTLSGGEQQMLAISRALMAKPTVLLLDEPSLGLAPQMVQTIFRVIREINAEGTTILLVEQNAHMALVTAHRGYVMETGKIVLADSTKVLLASDRIKKAYLGG